MHIIADIYKEIKYSRGDYGMYVTIDGERHCIGFASTHGQAEVTINQYVYDYLTDSHTIETAAEFLMQEAA